MPKFYFAGRRKRGTLKASREKDQKELKKILKDVIAYYFQSANVLYLRKKF